jgi:hypothetical protein
MKMQSLSLLHVMTIFLIFSRYKRKDGLPPFLNVNILLLLNESCTKGCSLLRGKMGFSYSIQIGKHNHFWFCCFFGKGQERKYLGSRELQTVACTSSFLVFDVNKKTFRLDQGKSFFFLFNLNKEKKKMSTFPI